MEIRNRLEDVDKLRCNVCQDFMKLVIRPGWQQILYNFAETAINNNLSYKEKYRLVYEKMRDIGVNNYHVDDMDVTIISSILNYSHKIGNIASADEETLLALDQLRIDKNQKSHASTNEEIEALYLIGLLDLVNLHRFVRTVDSFEHGIPEADRHAFRQKYIPKIEELKLLLDDERIELVQKWKEFDRDIQKVLDSEDQYNTWIKIADKYGTRYILAPEPGEKDLQSMHDFEKRASDKGIIFAHCRTADYLILYHKDFDEAERRLLMLYDADGNLPKSEIREIINVINEWTLSELPITDKLKKMIEDIRDQGYVVNTTAEGYYQFKGTKLE